MERAENLRAKHIRSIVKKVGNENIKVAEVTFINQMQTRNREIGLQKRLEDAEKRREERVATIRAKRAQLHDKGIEIKMRQKEKSRSESKKLMAEMNKRFDQAEERRKNRLTPERKGSTKKWEGPLLNLNNVSESITTNKQNLQSRRKTLAAKTSSMSTNSASGRSPNNSRKTSSTVNVDTVQPQRTKILLTKNKKKRARGYRKKWRRLHFSLLSHTN